MAIVIVQHGSANTGYALNNDPVILSYASNVVSGNTLIALIIDDGSSSGLSVSDNQNGAWAIDVGPVTLSGTGDRFYLARLQSTVGSVIPQVTASWSVPTGNKRIALFEVSGLQTTPYSQPSPNSSGMYYDGSPETAPLLSVTPSASPSLILTVVGTGSIPTTVGVTAGFTIEVQDTSIFNGVCTMMSLISINTNSISIDATLGSNGGWGIVAGTYLGVSGGSGILPILLNNYRQRNI